MRGKGKVVFVINYDLGITPAYAGKRSASFCKALKPKDHPRLCGEKLSNDESFPNRQRITPAYAGKSPFYSSF